MAPLILADAAEGARLQMDAIDADLRPWWASLSEVERAHPRRGAGPEDAARREPRLHLLRQPARPRRGRPVIYAEGAYDEAGGEALELFGRLGTP
jgi:hypothetical protein